MFWLVHLSLFALAVLILIVGQALSRTYHVPEIVIDVVAVLPIVSSILLRHKRRANKVD